jgi:hypothetical protein
MMGGLPPELWKDRFVAPNVKCLDNRSKVEGLKATEDARIVLQKTNKD